MRSAQFGSAVVLAATLLPGCAADPGHSRLTILDSTAIDQVRAEYVRAWLADDSAGVLATLDSTAVLLPPGRDPVTGHDSIRAYWWPADGSHTTITAFEWAMDELQGTPDLAFTRGTSTVSWRSEKDATRSEQTSRNVGLTILARGSDGKWRIMRQMWGPSLPKQ